MNYISIRKLVYKDRDSLEEFDILSDDESKINPFIYERLISIECFHPKHPNSNKEILQIFNDVYFFLTLFFWDRNPLIHYAEYRKITNPENHTDQKYQNIEWAELSVLYVILYRFNKTKWFKDKKSHAKMFGILSDEIKKRQQSYNNSLYSSAFSENVVIDECDCIDNTITKDSAEKFFYMDIERDFPLRNIEDLCYDNESLEECLWLGDEIVDAINLFCKEDENKLALIDALLELEDRGYGKFDLMISDAYKSLNELRTELTVGSQPPIELAYEMKANELEYFREENKELQKELDKANVKLKNKSDVGEVVGTVVVEEEKEDKPSPAFTDDGRIKELEAIIADLRKENSDLKEEIEDLEKREGIESPKAALLVRIALSKLGGLPANRENAWPLISYIWGCSESISKRRLKESVKKETIESLAKLIDDVSPMIARIIREGGQEILKTQKNC